MSVELYFSDHIEIINSAYDTTVYSPIYSEKLGLYLFNENEKPIREILLNESVLTIYYLDGEKKVLDDKVMFIRVFDIRFNKRMKMTIAGNLFKYDKKDALLYNLDMTKAFDYEIEKHNTRKRSI